MISARIRIFTRGGFKTLLVCSASTDSQKISLALLSLGPVKQKENSGVGARVLASLQYAVMFV